jgi:hypothetical protein
VTITFSLNFILIFSVLRTFTPANCSSKARVVPVSIHGQPLMLLLPSPLLPILVKKYPWISGIFGWVIQLLQLLVQLSRQINCSWFPPSYLPFVLHVSRARVIIFTSISVLLFIEVLCNYFLLMYGVRLQSLLLIVIVSI